MKLSIIPTLVLRSVMIALLFAAPHASFAADNSEAVIKQLIDQTSTELDKLYKAKRIGDRPALEQMIRTEIVPHIDQQRLTQRVFRQYWQQIVKANKQDDATRRVIDSLVRTYAVALSSYSGDTLSVISVKEDGDKSQARTRIRRPNSQIIQVDFSLSNSGGDWLINDMAVDGIVVSLTLFNAIKPVFEQQGLDAALNAVSEADAAPPVKDGSAKPAPQ
ncbi:MAG: ABC-type transporter, auxiliary component [Verrucomicrobiaceae bacterium]|nr:ABC-type transporter, auxiliary component [Verrucomicrobiaceae bacterium]